MINLLYCWIPHFQRSPTYISYLICHSYFAFHLTVCPLFVGTEKGWTESDIFLNTCVTVHPAWTSRGRTTGISQNFKSNYSLCSVRMMKSFITNKMSKRGALLGYLLTYNFRPTFLIYKKTSVRMNNTKITWRFTKKRPQITRTKRQKTFLCFGRENNFTTVGDFSSL